MKARVKTLMVESMIIVVTIQVIVEERRYRGRRRIEGGEEEGRGGKQGEAPRQHLPA
jgi:hypothetical protein